jgi:hypothetical protein
MHTNVMKGLITAALCAVTGAAHAIVLSTNEFNTTAENWGDRDGGEMTVGWTGSQGNPAGSMQGDFANGIFTPETDAFRLTTIPFGGDLTDGGTYDLVSFSFQFYADTVLPSDLILRFGNGSATFFRGFTLNSIDAWQTFTAPLTSVAGWFGGSQATFDTVLADTTFIELQVSRNSSVAQTYFFDNFQLNGELSGGGGGGGGGGPSAVPEPNTLSLLGFAAMIAAAMRRSVAARADTDPASPRPARRTGDATVVFDA